MICSLVGGYLWYLYPEDGGSICLFNTPYQTQGVTIIRIKRDILVESVHGLISLGR
jgi:hypothetical protein